MTTLLHLDASVRQERSTSRRLSASFVEAWIAASSPTHVIRRDLAVEPPPFVDLAWIAGAFTAPGERTPEMAGALAASETLIDELEKADVIVVGTPMYNYGMPARLKAWVDQVVRVDRTFSFDLGRGDFPLEPILSGKTLVLLTSSGEFGFRRGETRDGMDHLTPHFAVLSRYLGVASTHHVAVEYQEFGDDRHAASLTAALRDVTRLAETLAAGNAHRR